MVYPRSFWFIFADGLYIFTFESQNYILRLIFYQKERVFVRTAVDIKSINQSVFLKIKTFELITKSDKMMVDLGYITLEAENLKIILDHGIDRLCLNEYAVRYPGYLMWF